MKQNSSFLKLVDAFTHLNGVGPKTAERMAYNVLEMSEEDANYFITALSDAKSKIHPCPKCGLYTDLDECEICSDEERKNSGILIIISHPKDVYIFEKSIDLPVIYHVLGGNINISKGVFPNSLNIEKLLERIKEEHIKEVVIATNPTIEGETTALYLKRVLEPLNVEVTRLAYGLAIGSSLDYTDSLTLAKALEGRRKI